MKKVLSLIALLSFFACEKTVDLAATIEVKAQLNQTVENFTKGKFCADVHYVLNDSKDSEANKKQICTEGEVVDNKFLAAIDLNSRIRNPKGASQITVQSVKNVSLTIEKAGSSDVYSMISMSLKNISNYLYIAELELNYSKTIQTDKKVNDYLKCYNRLIINTNSERAHYRCREIVYGY